jgi:hypothetical protein
MIWRKTLSYRYLQRSRGTLTPNVQQTPEYQKPVFEENGGSPFSMVCDWRICVITLTSSFVTTDTKRQITQQEKD